MIKKSHVELMVLLKLVLVQHGSVKIVPDMTYNVFGGTLNLAQSINYGSVKSVKQKVLSAEQTEHILCCCCAGYQDTISSRKDRTVQGFTGLWH